MKVVFTARRIAPGRYEEFRRALEPERWPDGTLKMYILRDPGDPDQVTVLGLFDVSDERAAELQDELEVTERARHARMARFVEATLVSGLFDVAHTETGSATVERAAVPLTERRLRPGTFDQYAAAAQAAVESAGGPPPGLERIMVLRDTRDPEHVIQLGIARTGGEGLADRGGRDAMLRAIEPFVAGVGLDTTYELVEELTPAHA